LGIDNNTAFLSREISFGLENGSDLMLANLNKRFNAGEVPYVMAFKPEALEPKPQDRVLEIGLGSGYQAAVLSLLVREDA